MKRMKEPVNAITHLTGAALAIAGAAVLIVMTALNGSVWGVVSFSIYGASMIALYAASGIYHALNVSQKWERRLKKLDHCMIFMLIAGTYTPVCLLPLRGPWGWSLFGIIWGVAVMGILMKVFWIDAPRWLSTALYITMGWLCLIAIYPLLTRMSHIAFLWLALGGVFYTIGGVIYGVKKFFIKIPYFGFHEIFHLFVLAGSAFHYGMMWCLF